LQPQTLYEFGPYQLDPAEKVLRRGGVPVSLTPKAFETLWALVEKSGRVVEKAELMARVWPDAFVEEQNLAFNISVLRKTLGQDADGTAYIETVPKRGYRFTSKLREVLAPGLPVVTETHTVTRTVTAEEVEIDVDDESALARTSAIDLAPMPRVDSRAGVIADVRHQLPAPPRTRWRATSVVLAVLGLVAGIVLIGWLWKSQRSVSPTSFKAVPFTTAPGFESDPAISPDGNQIAYAWQKEGETNLHIYVQLVDSSTHLQLTNGASSESDPTWSPDGRRLAFFRSPDIHVISALGGPERNLGPADNGLMDWSPDGKTLAIIDKPPNSRDNSVFLMSVEAGDRRRLTFPPASGYDGTPTFSPDGQLLAFNRSVNSGNINDIYVEPASGGEPRRITNDNRIILGFAWASATELVFSSDRDGPRALWRVSINGGEPSKVDVGARSPTSPRISRSSHRLAFVESFQDANVWRLPLSASDTEAKPTKLISSTRYDSSAQYSPDGKRIVFRSDRSGTNEIWLCESDGNNPIQLTELHGSLAGSPRWSPDGKLVAFDSRHEGQSHIYVISADGGAPRRLAEQPPIQVVPRWSADGRFVYFFSNSDSQPWKAPVAGGEASHVPVNEGTGPTESADGKFIYFRRTQHPIGIFRVPTGGGPEETVLEMKEPPPWGYWTVVEKGIYFLVNGDKPKIEFFDFATRQITGILTMEKPALTADGGLAVSPDGQWLLFTQLDNSGSDIMLVNDFR
jgi:Tol biopolymer transport system component/DNA-binding winged helix-turn-helix (wHTH) protein